MVNGPPDATSVPEAARSLPCISALQVTPPGSGLANSQTKVAGSTHRPSPEIWQSIAKGAGPLAPSATIGSEKRIVKRVIDPPSSIPGVAISTCGGESAEAVRGASRTRKKTNRANKPRMNSLPGSQQHASVP